MPLSRFVQAKQAEIEALRALSNLPAPYTGSRPGFAEALHAQTSGAVIAEYKRASPSKGEINMGMGPEKVGPMYAQAGAAAISVLTEKTWFRGDCAYLDIMAATGLPLLRKDFITDPLQVAFTASTPASAILIIVRLFETDRELENILAACDQAGLEPVVEAFDARDLARAQHAGAQIIQINNRDLATLGIDMNRSFELIPKKQPGETWISASGITVPKTGQQMIQAGFDALLIGTALMSEDDPGKTLHKFTAKGL